MCEVMGILSDEEAVCDLEEKYKFVTIGSIKSGISKCIK